VARGEAFVDPGMTRAMIEGYLSKNRLPKTLDEPAQTDGLSEREIEVLLLVAQGFTNKEIAARLNIGVKTVETHNAHIAQKLGSKSRVDWLRYVRQKGWL